MRDPSVRLCAEDERVQAAHADAVGAALTPAQIARVLGLDRAPTPGAAARPAIRTVP